MCTVSVIPLGSGYRLIHSRDEQRSRAPGEPPQAIWSGSYAPADPAGGGTWITTREDGLTVAVMNRNPEPPPPAPHNPATRGVLPYRATQFAGPTGEGIETILSVVPRSIFRPFTLLAVGRKDDSWAYRVWAWDGEQLTGGDLKPAEPRCWVSSGLGDSVVAPRLPLFDEIVFSDSTPARQDAFHRHAWPDRGEQSVLMSREDARTVSLTTVTAGPDGPPTMAYQTVGEDGVLAPPIVVPEPPEA